MVEFEGTATAEFSAAHKIEGHLRCGRLHGHRWRFAVTIKAGQDPKTGELLGLPELATAVEQLANELDRDDLAAMLPAATHTPAGVGLALRERLILNFRTIIAVQVWMDGVSTTIRG